MKLFLFISYYIFVCLTNDGNPWRVFLKHVRREAVTGERIIARPTLNIPKLHHLFHLGGFKSRSSRYLGPGEFDQSERGGEPSQTRIKKLRVDCKDLILGVDV